MLMAGATVLAVIAGAVALAPWLGSGDPFQINARARFAPPSWARPFGGDVFGRDVLTRVLHGGRYSLIIGLVVVLATTAAGTALGAIAGYVRRLDGPIMRAMDALMAFPSVLLAIGVAAALGPRAENVVVALAVVYTPRTARIVRASTLVLRESPFVEAALASGAGPLRVLLCHILPNCLGPIVVQASFIFAYAVLSEAVMSYLGVGPPPPTPTWGNIIADGRVVMREAWWVTFYPGFAIAVTVLALNMVGDGLRDIFDPRFRVES
jgi:peptide/nickel transport system permease protein